MNKVKMLLLVVAAVLVQACSAPGPVFEQRLMQDNSAVLYVYRAKRFKGGGVYPYIYVDGEMKAPLKNGGYLAFDLEPGRHKIEAIGRDWKWDLPAKSVELVARAGKDYYIRLDYNVSIDGSSNGNVLVMNYGAGFGPVPEATGSEQIKKLKLSM